MRTLFQTIATDEYTKYRKGQMVSVLVKGEVFVGRYDRYDVDYGYHLVAFPVVHEEGHIALESSGFPESQVKEFQA